jgi:hypothetical protein
MDLAVVLPAHVACGIGLLRRRPLAYLVAPVLLAFGVLMALSIGGMMIVMRLRGADASASIAAGMTVLALASTFVLVVFLRRLPKRAKAPEVLA